MLSEINMKARLKFSRDKDQDDPWTDKSKTESLGHQNSQPNEVSYFFPHLISCIKNRQIQATHIYHPAA